MSLLVDKAIIPQAEQRPVWGADVSAAGPGAALATERKPYRGRRQDFPDPRPEWLDRGRIPCLDGLRALSIALVFVEHASLVAFHRPTGMLGWLVGNVGGIGVDVFFAISGFLITLLLLREWRRNDGISLKGFYCRRFLRLMPAAILFLLTVFAFQVAGRAHLEGRNWLHVVTYTVNFDPRPVWETAHLWSLSIEEQFYLLWPFTLLLLGPRKAGILAAAWLLGAPVLRFVMLRLHPHDMGRFDNWTPIRVDCIAAGCLLALVAGDERFQRWTRASRPVAMVLIAVAAAAMFLSYALGTRAATYAVSVGLSVRAACIAAVIWLSINHFRSGWGRLLDSRPFVVVGVLSYSLYLWQQLFLNPHAHGEGPSTGGAGAAGRVLLGVALAFAAATASYLMVERPFLRLKDRVGK
jgi:peptidoglycan/LPS O-acetylase OafA/YrhL